MLGFLELFLVALVTFFSLGGCTLGFDPALLKREADRQDGGFSSDAGAPLSDATASDGASSMEPVSGRTCVTANDCGGGDWMCLTGYTPRDGFCTRKCTNDSSQTVEQETCGVGGTCLINNAGSNEGYCMRTCDLMASSSGCSRGFACMGWWVGDAPGCYTHCTSDDDCPSGLRCNSRVNGLGCTPGGVNLALFEDGEPCNPMSPTKECRGSCFEYTSAHSTEGICASWVDRHLTKACPDNPDRIEVLEPPNHDLGLCEFRKCDTNFDCTAPLRCTTTPEAPRKACAYPAS